MSGTLLFCFLIGCAVGLRSLTAPAAICWGAHLGWLHFGGTKLAFIEHRAILVLFTLLALVELVSDKLPKTPARTKGPGLIARILFGAFCGAALAVSAGGNILLAAVIGIAGALAGTFGGYNLRHALAVKAHLPDFVVALAEDAVAIVGSLLIVSHL
ncbi:MAG TPA: DUF4126 family protein [Terriglobales bacterium]|jgi:uncharacterized membrane protein|nr:DUF4126 family protein [Terriglobales bacterium]